jgi:Predicted ATPase (AAA+ superfamily)
VFALPPYFDNFGKRVIKSPKYYFTDTGLLCYLLGIETTDQVSRDPLVGNLFENLVVLEALKARYNRGLTSMLYFYRDSRGHEIDLLYSAGGQLTGIEIKSSSTWTPAFKKALMTFSNRTTTLSKAAIVYSGKPMSLSDGIEVIHYADTDVLFR